MEDVLITLSIVVLMPWVVLTGIARIKKSKASNGGELRASDLRAFIREAVEGALQPLSTRVADLEERLGDESVEDLRSRLDPAVLADALDHDLEADDTVQAVARRTRS